MKIEILRCFKTDFGMCGEYYLHHENGGKDLIVQNCNDIKAIPHWQEKRVRDCITEITQEVADDIIIASIEYLKRMQEDKTE